MNQRVLARFVMPNQRGQNKQCEICKLKFQLLVKKEHQCKRCLRAVCQQCGPERRTVYEQDGSSSLHRCCSYCIKQIEQINEYHKKYKLCFGQDSQFVSDWINRINKDRISYDNILNEFSDNITSVTNDNTSRFKRQSGEIIGQLLDSYHYSFRHFIRVITQGVNMQMIQNKICNVMIAIFARVKTLPYAPQIIYLTVFFLCFANEAHTYFIITRIIQKIFPQYIHLKKMQKDKLLAGTFKTILEMYRICVDKVDRNQIEVIAQYLETRFSFYALTFTLNVCSLPCSFFIINQMLKQGSSLPFFKGMAGMLSFCREEVASYKNFYEVQIPLLRSVTVQKLKSCFIQFQKADAKFQVTNQVFDSVQHRKLHQKYKQMQALYTKSERSASQKQVKMKQILNELNLKKGQLQIEAEKNKKLQLELLKLSHNIPKLTKFQEMSSLYESLAARNKVLEQKCAQLEQKIEKLQKEGKVYDKYKRNWASMEQQYQKQIVQLRTKFEIMQIKVIASEIDFNTSFIQKKMELKNNEISKLTEQIKGLKTELQHYKLKNLQRKFNKAGPTSKGGQISSERQKEFEKKQKEFEKHIQNSKETVEKITKEITEIKQKFTENQKLLKQYEQKNNFLENRIKQTQEINKIIHQIPEYYNYIQAIQQMQRVIEKQTNFIKKKTLQSVKQSLAKCYRELKFRAIDCRIKQLRIVNNQIVNMEVNKLLNHSSDLKNEDNLLAMVNTVENMKDDQNAKKQCPIM